VSGQPGLPDLVENRPSDPASDTKWLPWLKSIDRLLYNVNPTRFLRLVIGSPTGGDKGDGAINAQAVYQDGDQALDVGGGQTITGGYLSTTFDQGTKSSGTFTPEPANGVHQKVVNNGAFTWAAPTTEGEFRVKVTNGSSAGVITFSGFERKIGTGALDTINTNKFLVTVGRIDGTDFYSVDPLQ